MVNLINTLAVVPPDGVWENIIFAFNNTFGNYAVAIILVTICIKLLLLPVDYFNRRSSAKMGEMQSKLGPKLAEIQKKYPDKMVQNQKTQELYQKEGFNPMGSCLSMVVVMFVSMAVFFTLFASLNNMAQYKITAQYDQLKNAYVQEYVMEEKSITTEEDYIALNLSDEDINKYITIISTLKDENGADLNESVRERANNAVKVEYDQVKESFLWIKNIWMADSPTTSAIPDFKSYATLAKLSLSGEEYTKAETEYNAVMGSLKETEGVNGFFILAVLTGVTAFFYQYLLSKKKKQKQNFYTQNAKPDPSTQTNKAMLIIMPVLMVMFTLSYNSIFAIYIIISQLVGIATAPLINYFINKPKKEKTKLQSK